MRLLRHLLPDTRGNVLMLTGLAILFLFAAAGAGVDFGRQQLVRMKLQNASDAAAVAAASMPASTTTEQRRRVALRYFNLNYPSTYLGVARPAPNIQIGNTISVDASASFSTNFVSNVGLERMQSQGRTVVNRTEPQNSIYDVILVMDNSNSMAEITTAPNFTALDQAQTQSARNLFTLTCRSQMTPYFNGVCGRAVFYSMADGTSRTYPTTSICRANAPTDFCNTVGNGPTGGGRVGYGFTGNTRLNALRSVAHNFVTRIITEGDPGSRIGIVTWNSQVLQTRALTNNTNLLRTDINNMAAFEGTNPYLAMQSASTLGNNFAANHVKAVVLLTDGKPTQTGPRDYTRDGYDSDNCDGGNFCIPAVNRTNPICTQLKSNGVQVYTIGFFSSTDTTMSNNDRTRARSFLQGCASTDAEGRPRYYEAPTGSELDAAFTQILTSLGRIRITQ